ncbi:MAG TPA: hypothetical protein GX005_06830 [Bacteroidales bacterium]|nr:hypothetical protein [Bacteroidales bacterium]
MKKIIILLVLSFISFSGFAQEYNYSIEHEYNKVGVFNPEWEIYNSINPRKFEHITGYYREELAKIIIDGVSSKRVKIYDIRKREISIDTVIKRVIEFEAKEFGNKLSKDSVFKFILPYISTYYFEEFIRYDYKTLALDKNVKAYCPTLVRYKSFTDEKIDTLELQLFWIFPESENTEFTSKPKENPDNFNIPDTVISLQKLKYPVQNPYSNSIFAKAKNKDASIFKSDGTKFKAPKEVDDLFILKRTILIENDETGLEEKREVVSDIIPEDINNIRIGETWSIDKGNLEIFKKVKYIIPLLDPDDRGFMQLGIRIQ